MGEAVTAQRYTAEQRTRYRERLNADLETFDEYLQDADFVDEGTIGMELELNLVDEDMQPSLCNQGVIEHLDGEDFQTEIGAYNFELNHPVLSLAGSGLDELRQGLVTRLDAGEAAAKKAGARIAMIGTLPTVTTELLKDPRGSPTRTGTRR